MQSKITSFTFANNEQGVLYGNYDNLRPISVHGIGHAFPNSKEVLITFYSLTGMKERDEHICSADLRLSVDQDSLAVVINQLQLIQKSFFSSTEQNEPSQSLDSSLNSKVNESEILSPPL